MTLPAPAAAVEAVADVDTGVDVAMPRAAPGAVPDAVDWACVWVLDCDERAEAEGGACSRKAAKKEERKNGRCEDGIFGSGDGKDVGSQVLRRVGRVFEVGGMCVVSPTDDSTVSSAEVLDGGACESRQALLM